MVAGALILSACERGAFAAPEPLDAGDIRGYITPELASHLSAGGTFQLPPPPDSLPVSPDEAKELALVFARRFGPHLRPTLERQHGGKIDFESLRVGSPAYFAESAFAPPEGDVHPAHRNQYGPYYMIYLVSLDGTPTLVVGVAANTGAWIENGRIRFPLHYGSDFYAEGVRRGEGFYKPLSPEQAVKRVSEATGALAAAVPELRAPDEEWHVVHSPWRVALNRPVVARAQGSSHVRQVREVYVGLRGAFSIPSAVQPTERVHPNAVTGGNVHVRILPDRPVAFEAVTLSGT